MNRSFVFIQVVTLLIGSFLHANDKDNAAKVIQNAYRSSNQKRAENRFLENYRATLSGFKGEQSFENTLTRSEYGRVRQWIRKKELALDLRAIDELVVIASFLDPASYIRLNCVNRCLRDKLTGKKSSVLYYFKNHTGSIGHKLVTHLLSHDEAVRNKARGYCHRLKGFLNPEDRAMLSKILNLLEFHNHQTASEAAIMMLGKIDYLVSKVIEEAYDRGHDPVRASQIDEFNLLSDLSEIDGIAQAFQARLLIDFQEGSLVEKAKARRSIHILKDQGKRVRDWKTLRRLVQLSGTDDLNGDAAIEAFFSIKPEFSQYRIEVAKYLSDNRPLVRLLGAVTLLNGNHEDQDGYKTLVDLTENSDPLVSTSATKILDIWNGNVSLSGDLRIDEFFSEFLLLCSLVNCN